MLINLNFVPMILVIFIYDGFKSNIKTVIRDYDFNHFEKKFKKHNQSL